jgi:hypothetical protein
MSQPNPHVPKHYSGFLGLIICKPILDKIVSTCLNLLQLVANYASRLSENYIFLKMIIVRDVKRGSTGTAELFSFAKCSKFRLFLIAS